MSRVIGHDEYVNISDYMPPINFFSELNVPQKQAVDTTEGPLLILAGAGAGKTKTLTFRMLNLIRKGIHPRNILAITFTNKAAQEMKDRVLSLIANDPQINRPISFHERPFVGTFHSLCVNIIKENAEILGSKRHFSIYDRDDSKRVVRDALKHLGYDPKEYDPGRILSIISREKGNFINRDAYVAREGGDYIGSIVGKVWEKYDGALRKENAYDFDDLLCVVAKLLKENAEVRKGYSERWKYIHIDEYQDTNEVQYSIAKSLAEEHRNICAVGDIDQNIYSWRGANIKNILNFEKDYPEGKVIVLEENYRSTQTILAIANRVIEKNKMRRKKTLFTSNGMGEKVGLFEALDEAHEASFVANKIKSLNKSGVPLSEIAVLYRANFQSRALEEAMLSKEVPYQVLGTRFFDRKEVKDVIAFLRLALNPESVADLARVINVPPRGIGKVTLLKIVEGKEEALPAKVRDKVVRFRQILAKIKNSAMSQKPSETLKVVIEASGLSLALSKNDEENERAENLKELVALATRYDELPPEDGIEALLADVSLTSDQDSQKDSESVRLMTVHASKGLEFDCVFVTGLEEGLFPSDKNSDKQVSDEEAEEERRLFYVAVTRARKKLFLTYAQTRTVFGSRGVNIPSEFIFELDDNLVEHDYLDYPSEGGPRRHKPLLEIEF